MVGVVSDDLASQVEGLILRRSGLSSERCKDMLRELLSLPDLPTAERAIDVGERFSRLDDVMVVMCAPASLPDGTVGPFYRSGTIDFNLILQRVNAIVDGDIAPLRVADYAERRRMSDRHRAEYEASFHKGWATWLWRLACYFVSTPGVRLQYRSELFGDSLVAFITPNIGHADDHRLAAAMRRRVVQAAYALAAWHAEKGNYPKDLAELIPDYLPRVPIDEFSGGPLVYKPGDAGYLLYSVGRNGRDDGGESSKSSNADDIVIRAGDQAGR